MGSVADRELGVRQVDWDNVERAHDQPLITIITSTYNAAKDLHWTGDSIRDQTYSFVQWIIADGASQDNTLSIVKQYEDVVDVWFSEPDEGIYDAWNKALKYAKGDWVQFVGAGDELAEPTTLEQVAPFLATAHPKHDLVYGNLVLLTEVNRVQLDFIGEPWDTMKGKWSGFRPKLPGHPAVFHHKSLFGEKEPFDLQYKIAADSYFMLKSVQGKEPYYLDILIDRMSVGGVSGSFISTLNYCNETRKIAKEFNRSLPLRHEAREYLLLVLKYILLKILPDRVTYLIADLFRRLCGKRARWSCD